jgi:hypothetical protein
MAVQGIVNDLHNVRQPLRPSDKSERCGRGRFVTPDKRIIPDAYTYIPYAATALRTRSDAVILSERSGSKDPCRLHVAIPSTGPSTPASAQDDDEPAGSLRRSSAVAHQSKGNLRGGIPSSSGPVSTGAPCHAPMTTLNRRWLLISASTVGRLIECVTDARRARAVVVLGSLHGVVSQHLLQEVHRHSPIPKPLRHRVT